MEIGGRAYQLLEDIPFGHKIALRDFACGEEVVKYGEPIGHITEPVKAGGWVHSHNLATNLEGLLEYSYNPAGTDRVEEKTCRDTFEGYRRPDGSVGTRNEIWIIPTVSCVNTTVRKIAAEAGKRLEGMCDGVFAFPHNAGCCLLYTSRARAWTNPIFGGTFSTWKP